MIGSLGTIAFSASSDKVNTFSGFSKTGEARYSEHALSGKKPLLEFIGPGLEKISFTMRLDVGLGVNPKTEIKKLIDLRDAGEASILCIGGEFIGMFVIKSLAENHKAIDNAGRLLLADINVSLEEYADDRV
ncbi:MAG: phage tail protein [Methyloprofundus sp.]|nr:phage tail protein [Methyloprofundus sp.]